MIGNDSPQTQAHGSQVVAKPFVSIIIPVYNDAARLKLCLTALDQQTYPPNRYEIIVVDNGSDPAESVDGLSSEFSRVVMVRESTPGSYAARNKGLTVAQGEVIAFTDSDCIPAPNWLEKGVDYLQGNPNCGLVAGAIEMFVDNPDQVTAAELYDQVILGFPQKEFLRDQKAGMTANVFTRKQVFEQVGGFCSTFKSQGDLEWGSRVYAAGYEQIYGQAAQVGHPTRKSLRALWQRTRRLSGGVYDRYVGQETSRWVRSRRLVRLIIGDLFVNSLNGAQRVFQDERLSPWPMRLRVLGLVGLMQMVSATEKIWLWLGGQPCR